MSHWQERQKRWTWSDVETQTAPSTPPPDATDGSTQPRLSSESVQGASLSLESVDDVKGSHSLSASVLSVGDSVTDNVLKEHLEHSTGLLVDQSGDTLHTSTASQTTNGWLGDSLDVVTQHLSVTLGATLSEAFTSLSTSGHVE